MISAAAMAGEWAPRGRIKRFSCTHFIYSRISQGLGLCEKRVTAAVCLFTPMPPLSAGCFAPRSAETILESSEARPAGPSTDG